MKTKALKTAFPHTIPILAGFAFLGMTYGIYMNVSGFPFWYPLIMSIVIFGGSLEFLATSMLLSPFAPLQVFLVTLMVQARHLFYGISMLDKYRSVWHLDDDKADLCNASFFHRFFRKCRRFYLIFGLCDETFSINYTADIPEDVDRGWFYYFVTLLNRLYWIAGATIGGLCGNLIHFNTEGLDFVMTAMFVVIFLDQWLKEKHHISQWIGFIASVTCLALFGADNFMVPTMICILLALSILKKPIEEEQAEELLLS